MYKEKPSGRHGIKFKLPSAGLSKNNPFKRLLEVFHEIMLATSGDVGSTFQWMNEIDRRYGLFPKNYRLPDFIKDLEQNKFIRKDSVESNPSKFIPTGKFEISLRQNAFLSLFGKIKKSKPGHHTSKIAGKSDEFLGDLRPFEFGDSHYQIEPSESIKNAIVRHGTKNIEIDERDLVSYDSAMQSQCATVLMIDISHSMVLYGEDRITPAKKVAIALSEMIRQYYPKDKLDIVVFGDEAWQIRISDIPYLEVGPYHTNTVAGLNLAISLLNKSKSPNKHIMMITDGKPSCIKRGKEYYKNAFGLDPYIINRTLALARKCRKSGIAVTTFMVSTDPYLIEFIEQFSKEAKGKSFYTGLEKLGDEIFSQYNKRKNKF